MALFDSELLFSPGRTRGPTSVSGAIVATLTFVFHSPDISITATITTLTFTFHAPDASINDDIQLGYTTPLFGPESVTDHVTIGIAWLTPASVSDDYALAFAFHTPDASISDDFALSYRIT